MSADEIQHQGCRTCRRRRVRCDERDSGCRRCERDEKPRIKHRIEKQTLSTFSKSASPVVEKKPAGSLDVVPLEFVHRIQEKGYSSPAQTLDLKGFQNNIEIAFTTSQLTKAFPWFSFWLLDDPDPERSVGLQALSKAYFGRAHKQKAIMENGALCYIKGLRHLNSVLQDPDQMLQISALTSAMKLSMYEFVTGQSTNWVRHSWGIARLVQMRGPESCINQLEIFDGHRLSLILLYLRARKRCFLECEEWRAIPWSLAVESKTMSAYLQDLLAFIPGFFEDVETLKTKILSKEQRESHCMSLQTNISKCVQSLYRWRIQWEIKFPQNCFEVDTARADSPFPRVLYYSSLERANDIAIYHMTLLMLVAIASPFALQDGTSVDIRDSLLAYELAQQPLRGTNAGLSLPSRDIDEQRIARDICRSAEFHFLEQNVDSGALSLLLPLRTATDFLEVDSKEETWARSTLRKASAYVGFEGKEYIADVE